MFLNFGNKTAYSTNASPLPFWHIQSSLNKNWLTYANSFSEENEPQPLSSQSTGNESQLGQTTGAAPLNSGDRSLADQMPSSLSLPYYSYTYPLHLTDWLHQTMLFWIFITKQLGVAGSKEIVIVRTLWVLPSPFLPSLVAQKYGHDNNPPSH